MENIENSDSIKIEITPYFNGVNGDLKIAMAGLIWSKGIKTDGIDTEDTEEPIIARYHSENPDTNHTIAEIQNICKSARETVLSFENSV